MDTSEASLSEAVQELGSTSKPSPADGRSRLTSRTKHLRWFELCLVLLTSFGGPFFNSLNTLLVGHAIQLPPRVQTAEWAESIVREAVCLLLLGYVLSRRKLRIRDFGLRLSVRDLVIGFALAIISAGASYTAYRVGHSLTSVAHGALASTLAGGVTAKQLYSNSSLIVFPFTILNAFFEELIVRAYLMTEIRELTGSWILSVIASVVVQTSYHVHYGWIGALSVALGFLVFSIYYARTRKATPIIFAHALIDLYSLSWLF